MIYICWRLNMQVESCPTILGGVTLDHYTLLRVANQICWRHQLCCIVYSRVWDLRLTVCLFKNIRHQTRSEGGDLVAKGGYAPSQGETRSVVKVIAVYKTQRRSAGRYTPAIHISSLSAAPLARASFLKDTLFEISKMWCWAPRNTLVISKKRYCVV